MKKKALDILIIIVGIVILITIILIAIKYGSNRINEEKMTDIVEQIKLSNLEEETTKQDEQVEMPNESSNIEKITEIKIDGYTVLGIIRIPKIGLEYPILNQTTNKSMKKSITKFWGPSINEIGNLSLAGHNNKDGTMFGKVKKLKPGDVVEIEDLYKNVIKYEIFDIYVTDPNDVSCVESVKQDTREVTLITCTNGNKNRLIAKAREIL